MSWKSSDGSDLFGSDHSYPEQQGPFQARIPLALLQLLESASQFRGDQRWSLLYEVLWRVSHGDRTAMLAGDKLGSELHRRIKQVSREAHHLHAFCVLLHCPNLSCQSNLRSRNTSRGTNLLTTSCTAPVSILSAVWGSIGG